MFVQKKSQKSKEIELYKPPMLKANETKSNVRSKK